MTRGSAIGARATLSAQEDHGDDGANLLARTEAEAEATVG
jgi:hypothetical protein